MKTLFIVLVAFLGFTSCLTTYQVQPSHVATDNFVVLRRGYNSAAARMQVFVDSQLAGKVGGYRYLSLSLPAGPHEVYFKFSPLVSRSARRSFQVAEGEKKFFMVRKKFLRYGVDITEADSLPAEIEAKKGPKVR